MELIALLAMINIAIITWTVYRIESKVDRIKLELVGRD